MIGHKIKNIRELKNLTQEYMAEKLDISQAAYSKLEKGEIKISDEKLVQISNVLEVRPDDIKSFDSQKYFNSVSNVEGDYSGIYVYIGGTDSELVKKLHEDKITLLEELLKHHKNELSKYQSKYGDL
jgi:transcriptional regulator with XRE-family HTH domain